MRLNTFLALCGAIFSAGPASAYVLMSTNGTAGFWEPGEISLQLRFADSPTLQDGSTWSASAQAALAQWNAQLSCFKVTGIPASAGVGGSANAQNEAFFAADVFGQSFGPDVAAVTIVTHDVFTVRNTEADVIFNSAMNWDSYRGAPQAALDFRRVALHEFGHLLGLDHPDDFAPGSAPTVMDRQASNLEQLTADDIAGAQFLYGPGVAPVWASEPKLNLVAARGSSVQLSYHVTGSPPLHYKLYRDDQLVLEYNDRESATIQFNSAADFGTYQLVVSNRAGTTPGQKYVFREDTQQSAPFIVSDLRPLSLNLGESGRLGVVASASPSAHYRWLKDGRDLLTSDSCALVVSGTRASAGRYQVVVSNTNGEVRSAEVAVKVGEPGFQASHWVLSEAGLPASFFYDVAYGDGRFVAVGELGAIYSSDDAINWTRHEIGTAGQLNGVVYTGHRFVVGGQYDLTTGAPVMYTSVDGIGWAPATSGLGNGTYIAALAAGNNRVLAADLYGRIYVSTDGLGWTTSSWQAPSGIYLAALAYGNGRFVVAGQDARVWSSTDGQSWQAGNSGVSSGLVSIAYGNGRFVGVSLLPMAGSADKVAVATSTDGQSWTAGTVTALNGGAARIAFVNGRFHVTSRNGDHLVSGDGQSWQQRNFATHSATVIGYGDGRYVGLGFHGESYVSGDGLHWSPNHTTPAPVTAVAYTNGQFLQFNDTYTGHASSDGVTWNRMALSGYGYNSAAYGNGTWVAVTGTIAGRQWTSANTIAYSTTVDAWSTLTNPVQAELAFVAFGAGKFVAVGEGATPGGAAVAVSSNGQSWSETTLAGRSPLRGVTYGPAGFVAVGVGGTILRSTDGITWTAQDAHTTKDLWAVTYGAGSYIAVGGTGNPGSLTVVAPGDPVVPNSVVSVSPDGVSWTTRVLPYREPLYSVAETGGLVVAGGSLGATVYSRDLATWLPGPRVPRMAWRLAAGNGRFFAAESPSLFQIDAAAFTPNVTLFRAPTTTTQGTDTTITFDAAGPGPYQVKWYRDQTLLGESTGTTWTTATRTLTPGVYFAELTGNGGGTTRTPVVVAPIPADLPAGDITRVATDIHHPNGNIYDQYLLTGAFGQFRAEPGKVARLSFRDLSEDIVQVEMSGAGMVTVWLDDPSGPALAPNYAQDVLYMKGHARVFVSDADETTNLMIYSVGNVTAVNQALFRPGVAYDGVADLALVAIQSRTGAFGGLRLGNTDLWAVSGSTGVWAPFSRMFGPMVIGNISARDSAVPGLYLSGADKITVAGSDLAQANGQAIAVGATPRLEFVAGSDSNGGVLPVGHNAARYLRDGVDVTATMAP